MQLDPGAHSRDLRVRTLSSILAALQCTDASFRNSTAVSPVPEPAIPLPAAANSELKSPYSSSRKGRSRLELLNQVALLLVREHRIVGVLPKRSGPKAILELLVATDSESDSPDIDANTETPQTTKLDATKYIIVRNPRRNPPTDPAISHDSTVILQHLDGVATGQQLLAHLNIYKSVPFSCHIASVELLLNKIISSPRQRLASRKLFSRYITFRCVPKMRRRFQSPAFQSYLTAIHAATKTQISAEVAYHYQRRSSNTYPTAIFASTECILIGGILFFEFFDRSTCPYLVGQLQAGLLVEYNPETAFEFHQILLFAQKMAMDSVTHLSRACKSTDTNCVEAALANTELWMKMLYQLVQCSPIFGEHMDIIEAFVSPQRRSLEPAPMAEVTFQEDNDAGNGPSDATIEISQAQGDNDADNGPSDATIEISQAQATHRVAHQSLRLAVSYQQAIESVTNSGTLPAEPLKLTLWEPPAEIVQRTAEMEPWQDIIKNMYPDNADGAGNFTSKEVIDTLQGYARQHGKSKFFLRAAPRFGGCYHAEAMLGTLAYLGHRYHPTTAATETPATETPVGQELTLFQHTYRHIGVSKRCCPICTKLLSLLSTSYNSGQPLIRVLSGHQNIYPTALPPFVPEEVAEALIKWLEGLVRTAVARLVKRRRRASDASSVSSKSDDSKIDSPEQGGEEGEEEGEAEQDAPGWSLEGGRGAFALWSLCGTRQAMGSTVVMYASKKLFVRELRNPFLTENAPAYNRTTLPKG
ncbi:hypothetical protein BGX38DRAFT_1256654 [Terfezia claveryi]|nr:hypothetical protein BGX38DRAFT_1256654 [Terfezia claveryi]